MTPTLVCASARATHAQTAEGPESPPPKGHDRLLQPDKIDGICVTTPSGTAWRCPCSPLEGSANSVAGVAYGLRPNAVTADIAEVDNALQAKEREKAEPAVQMEKTNGEIGSHDRVRQEAPIFATKRRAEELRAQRDDLLVRRREADLKLFQAGNKKQALLADLAQVYRKAERTRFKRQLDIADFLRQFVVEQRMNEMETRHYGMVVENITCPHEYARAVEAVAEGASLLAPTPDDAPGTCAA